MAESLATLAIQEYVHVGKGNTQLTPARDPKPVWYAYTQAIGGGKMPITGNRLMLKNNHIKYRHHYTYLETSQAPHINGQNLHIVIDQSLLRKMCKPLIHVVKLHDGKAAKNSSGYTFNGNRSDTQESWYLNKWECCGYLQTL